MAQLSAASGLQKASLYYRFPNGKSQMADETLDFVGAWFEVHIFSILRSSAKPSDRIASMTDAIRRFYEGGSKPCMLEALSLGQADPGIHRRLQAMFEAWKQNLASVVSESGKDPAESAAIAEQMIALIEGALIIRRLNPKSDAFERSLNEISRMV
jgi:AcrR family transcriptional regulator